MQTFVAFGSICNPDNCREKQFLELSSFLSQEAVFLKYIKLISLLVGSGLRST